MKIIIDNATLISKYVFDDNEEVTLIDTKIITSKFIIDDMNKNNATLIDITSIPNDWVGGKYLYDNGFNINPNWVEPALTAQINGLD